MIICSCNVLSDRAVREALRAVGIRPVRVVDVHRHLGFKAKCGNCANAIRAIMDQMEAEPVPDEDAPGQCRHAVAA